MADILITVHDRMKEPSITLKALTEQGLSALREAHGSHCSSMTIAKGRLGYAKKFMSQRGCCVVVVPAPHTPRRRLRV